MEKSFLEKQIEQKAKYRVDQAMRDFLKVCELSPIFTRLKIWNKKFINFCGQTWWVFFNWSIPKDAIEETNITEIKNDLLERYIKEETDLILSKIDSIWYIFSQQLEQTNEETSEEIPF